ncbi:uncharacterized protein [Clytia hemisphaerica]|uniref:uncharacterized protein isoform X2 n=1 Tax=Clytia hemisphaerica TaxID=252671 RepID=UPI0034D49708
MPPKNKQKFLLYPSIEELDKVIIKESLPIEIWSFEHFRVIMKQLKDIFEIGKKHYKEGHLEYSYIMMKKYLKQREEIDQYAEYRKDYYKEYFNKENDVEASKIWSLLYRELSKRYAEERAKLNHKFNKLEQKHPNKEFLFMDKTFSDDFRNMRIEQQPRRQSTPTTPLAQTPPPPAQTPPPPVSPQDPHSPDLTRGSWMHVATGSLIDLTAPNEELERRAGRLSRPLEPQNIRNHQQQFLLEEEDEEADMLTYISLTPPPYQDLDMVRAEIEGLSWYHPKTTKEEAETILKDQPPGSYLLRDSSNKDNKSFSFSIRLEDGIKHMHFREEIDILAKIKFFLDKFKLQNPHYGIKHVLYESTYCYAETTNAQLSRTLPPLNRRQSTPIMPTEPIYESMKTYNQVRKRRSLPSRPGASNYTPLNPNNPFQQVQEQQHTPSTRVPPFYLDSRNEAEERRRNNTPPYTPLNNQAVEASIPNESSPDEIYDTLDRNRTPSWNAHHSKPLSPSYNIGRTEPPSRETSSVESFHEYHYPDIDEITANMLLRDKHHGQFLVRNDKTKPEGNYILSIRKVDGNCEHVKFTKLSSGNYTVGDPENPYYMASDSFPRIEDAISSLFETYYVPMAPLRKTT